MATPVVSFLSDYGLRDEFVGVCHGVIARACPAARIIDVTHGIPAQDVRTGALVLRDAAPYLPVGVVLAVVDPGVGGARRALALRVAAEGRVLVGPDNGLLMPAAERLGGVTAAVDLGDSPAAPRPRSQTFHGRDLFAPVAAALACGASLEDVGAPLSPDTLVRLELTTAQLRDGRLHARVARIDGFGNVVLDASGEQLRGLAVGAVEHRGASHRARRVATFADGAPDELLVYEDAQGWAALAVRDGSAAALLGAAAGEEVVLSEGPPW